jgi:hypothetical protein
MLIKKEQKANSLRSVAATANSIQSCRIDGTVHPATVVRWICRGVQLRKGSILRLSAVRSPGGWLIAPSAVDDFLAALTADRICEPAPPPAAASAARDRRHARTAAELDAAGITTPRPTKRPGPK